jgi:hypothetical protein
LQNLFSRQLLPSIDLPELAGRVSASLEGPQKPDEIERGVEFEPFAGIPVVAAIRRPQLQYAIANRHLGDLGSLWPRAWILFEDNLPIEFAPFSVSTSFG